MPVSYYIDAGFDKKRSKAIVAEVVKKLNLSGLSFDAIAVRGTSGLIIGPIVAHLMDKYLIVVRKTKENSHASNLVECPNIRAGRYIIIDDCIASGNTVNAIVDEVKAVNPKLEPIGIFLWNTFPSSTIVSSKVKLRVIGRVKL